MKIKPLAKNRKARFEYDIQKTFEAGIVLKGTEVKSIRSGQINLAESYCRVDEKMQVYLLNAHISHYDYGNRNNHEPLRPRRLLLHRSEIRRLYGQLKEQGLTLIPLKIYLKDGLIYYLMIRSRSLKALNDGIEKIEAIHTKTQIEMNILLATLLELELTGTLENIGGQIYRLAAELDITVH